MNPKTVSFKNTLAGAFKEWSNSCFIGLNFNTGFSINIASHKIERETGTCNVFLLKYTPGELKAFESQRTNTPLFN
jgi:hypothetical protein